MFTTKGLRIGAVRGIDVRVDASWLIIAALVTWSYWVVFERRAAHSSGEAFVMALVAAVLFFASVLAHELAHALEAQHRGVHVASITLFLFGGVTETSFDVKRPVDEFALTAVGPFTSFVIGAVMGLIATGADELGLGSVAAVAGLLGWINVALGAFNLLPGAPLDGGRILRAGVWWVTGDRDRSVRVAARTGQLLGGVILVLGILQIFFVRGGFAGGLWFAFIGWFLARAAGAELADSDLRRSLGGLVAVNLIDPRPALDGHLPVSAAVSRFMNEDIDEVAVTQDGEFIGVIGVEQVRGIPGDRRGTVLVREAVTPTPDLPTVAADDPAAEVLDKLANAKAVVVESDGAPIGIVTGQRIGIVIRRARQFNASGTAR